MKGLKQPLAHIVIPQDPKSMEELRVKATLAETTLLVTKTPSDLSDGVNALQGVVADLKKEMAEMRRDNTVNIQEAVIAAVNATTANQHGSSTWQPNSEYHYSGSQNFTQFNQFQNRPQQPQRPRQFNQQNRFPVQQRFPVKEHFQQIQCHRCGMYCGSSVNCFAKYETCGKCLKQGHLRRACNSNFRVNKRQ